MYSSRILLGCAKLTINRGVDFDDPDYGFKEEDKDEGKVGYNHSFPRRYTNRSLGGERSFTSWSCRGL